MPPNSKRTAWRRKGSVTRYRLRGDGEWESYTDDLRPWGSDEPGRGPLRWLGRLWEWAVGLVRGGGRGDW